MCFFFFKQKTAYEMRISDWSSDVCSSDLLRGLALDGTERPGARDRNGLRNALFADLLVTTGLRLEEASGLLAHELAAIDHDHDQAQQLWLPLPPPLTKGDRGRSVLVPRRLLRQIAAFVAVERAAAVTKFVGRDRQSTRLNSSH